MIRKLAQVGGIGRWIDPRKSPEIMNKVRLIKIAALRSHDCPIGDVSEADDVQHFLEPLHPAKALWGQSDRIVKQPDDPSRAQPNLVSYISDGARSRQLAKFSQGECNGRMTGEPGSLLNKGPLEDHKPGIRCWGFQQPFAQLGGFWTPQFFKRDLCVVQLTSRQVEEWEPAAALECGSHYRPLATGINDDELGARACNQ